MPATFDALPGIEVPVEAITKSLARLWADHEAGGGPAPESESAKATQVNFVLHLGINTQPDDAARQFETMVNFARRHPARVVVLCPLRADVPEPLIRAKIHGVCFPGRSPVDTRCVEFVLLSYSLRARPYLENQVSVCLAADLPMYYWAHRFSTSGRLADYRYLLSRAKRVLLDSATSPADALTYPWPNPGATRDLAYCRLLPVRQAIGQFLAAYSPERISAGLEKVEVSHDDRHAAEGRVMSEWLRRRLRDCGVATEALTVDVRAGGAAGLGVRFSYGGAGRFFRWSGDLAAGQAAFEADFGTGMARFSSGISLLSPEAALSEAMFF